MVGNFGGTRRFDYTAHGDAINTAARLKPPTRRSAPAFCVARSTMEACDEGAFRPIGTLSLRGKARTVDVLDPLPASEAEADFTRRYRAAYAISTRARRAPSTCWRCMRAGRTSRDRPPRPAPSRGRALDPDRGRGVRRARPTG